MKTKPMQATPPDSPITIDRPVTFTMSPQTLSLVLRGLELMPYGQVKAAFEEIQSQIVKQFQAPPLA
jgi:hypothetical protein